MSPLVVESSFRSLSSNTWDSVLASAVKAIFTSDSSAGLAEFTMKAIVTSSGWFSSTGPVVTDSLSTL